MEYYMRSIRATAASMFVALTVITAGVPMAAQAAGQPAQPGQSGQAGQSGNANQKDNEEKRKIGEANDLKLKGQDPLYVQQAKALAQQYRETAAIVASQGGNAQPILDAAARLDSQSDFIAKARQSNHLPLQLPEVAPHPAPHK